MSLMIDSFAEEQKFMINDLRFWTWAFDQFIGDVRDLLPEPGNLPRQYSLEQLDNFLREEFLQDAEHQRNYWLYYDRAAEAIPLLESDGPEHGAHPIEGFGQHMDMRKVREHNEVDAYINLVGANIDRKLGDLAGFNPNFYAEPMYPEHAEQIEVLNKYMEFVKDNNNFKSHWGNFKHDLVTIGSGVMKFCHDVNYNASELGLMKKMIERRGHLTLDELVRFKDVFNYHQFEYVPSFNVVRFRGASGNKSKSLQHPCHRQLHYFEHMNVADARNRYPERSDKISPGTEDKAFEISPELSHVDHEISDMTTLIHSYIRFPVREQIDIPLMLPSGQTYDWSTEQPRYAIGHITRDCDGGILDMKLDYYDHGNYEFVQAVNFPSSKHACGIGMIKFGRDPAIIHNQLHNGALRYLGHQNKGTTFYLGDIIDKKDLEESSMGPRYIKIDIQKARQYINRNDSLRVGDLIQDTRPPNFPSAWAGLMEMEEQALDRAMKSGSAWLGNRTGYSGKQQAIASGDAAMMHVNTHEELKVRVKEMSDIAFANVVQFDGDRYIAFTAEDEVGDRHRYELNKPMHLRQEYDPQTGIYKTVPSYIMNNVGQMNFITKVEPESIIPDSPGDRVNFYMQLLQFIYPYTQTPHGRIMLRGFQTEGMRIPSLRSSLDQIDEYDRQTMQLQAQMQEIAQEYEKLQDDREYALDKAETNQNLLRLTHKFVSDLTSANPETLQQLLGNNQRQITQQLVSAIQGLLTGDRTTAGKVPQQPMRSPELQQLQNTVEEFQSQQQQ